MDKIGNESSTETKITDFPTKKYTYKLHSNSKHVTKSNVKSLTYDNMKWVKSICSKDDCLK